MVGTRLKFKIRGGIRIKLPPGKERYHPIPLINSINLLQPYQQSQTDRMDSTNITVHVGGNPLKEVARFNIKQ